MPIQETPPLGWPHTEAAKYYDKESQTILQKATPPAPTKKRGGCCSGFLVTLLIVLAVAGVIVAVALDQWEENGDPAGEPIELAEETYIYENPGWDVEAAAYIDGTDAVQLVTWSNEYGIGRVVRMEPDEVSAHGWNEQALLPSDVDWSEPHFYTAFSDAFASVHWTYVESVEPAFEGDYYSVDGPAEFTVSYSIWGEDTSEWSETFATVAALDETGVWLISTEATGSATQ